MRRTFFVLIISLMGLSSFSQTANIPLNEDYYSKIERYRVLNGSNSDEFHPSFKPYQRIVSTQYLQGLDSLRLSEADEFNISYLLSDSWELVENIENESKRTFLKHFYKIKPDAFYVNEPGFDLHINPVMHFMAGTSSVDDDPIYINTRGIEVRGRIDEKVGFYSFIGENQMGVPKYVDDYPNGPPSIGFRKGFKGTGYDFFTARGYISFNATQHINLQLGYDRHKTGNGIRSLLLSDFAPPNLFFKIQTKIWKFNYTNLYTQLTQERALDPNTGRYPDKYLTLHHLSLNITPRLNIGLFEAIMSGGNQSGGYELKYLNPVIFYRAMEQQNGSADNAMVGLDAEYILTKGISLYSQFVLDEFLLRGLTGGDGWWGNKYGLQLGLNYYNLGGIDNLDFKFERNNVRPYTYAHYTAFGSYSHFEQPLAHPWGANFKETIVELRYQPVPRMEITNRFVTGTVGKDMSGSNWGSNILLDYNTREQENGNETGQGIATNISTNRFRVTYMFKHNLFIDLGYTYRQEKSDQFPTIENHIFQGALRFNIADRIHEF